MRKRERAVMLAPVLERGRDEKRKNTGGKKVSGKDKEGVIAFSWLDYLIGN